MQHNKITDNLGEFQKFIDSDSKTGMCLEDTIRFFDIQRIFGQFESVKQSGIRVTMIMTTLLVMLFYRSRNIHSYFSRQQVRQLEKRAVLNSLRDEMNAASKKTLLLEYEKQEKRVSRSKKKQSSLRKSMKLTQAILEEKGLKTFQSLVIFE